MNDDIQFGGLTPAQQEFLEFQHEMQEQALNAFAIPVLFVTPEQFARYRWVDNIDHRRVCDH